MGYVFVFLQRPRNNRFHSTSRAGRPIRSRFLAAMRGRVGNKEPRVFRADAGRFRKYAFLNTIFRLSELPRQFLCVRVGKNEADSPLAASSACVSGDDYF